MSFHLIYMFNSVSFNFCFEYWFQRKAECYLSCLDIRGNSLHCARGRASYLQCESHGYELHLERFLILSPWHSISVFMLGNSQLQLTWSLLVRYSLNGVRRTWCYREHTIIIHLSHLQQLSPSMNIDFHHVYRIHRLLLLILCAGLMTAISSQGR